MNTVAEKVLEGAPKNNLRCWTPPPKIGGLCPGLFTQGSPCVIATFVNISNEEEDILLFYFYIPITPLTRAVGLPPVELKRLVVCSIP